MMLNILNISIQVPDETSYQNIKEALESILQEIIQTDHTLPRSLMELITITHKQDTKSFFIPAHY